MLDLLIIFILFLGLVFGFRRGFVAQGIRWIGFFISLLISYFTYKKLANIFVLWVPYPNVQAHEKLTWAPETLDLDMTFYKALAFVVIFFIAYVVVLIVLSTLDYIRYVPLMKFETRFIGAALGFFEVYFLFFFLFSVLALLPLDFVQQLIQRSLLARTMFDHTPFISKMFQNWWFTYTTN